MLRYPGQDHVLAKLTLDTSVTILTQCDHFHTLLPGLEARLAFRSATRERPEMWSAIDLLCWNERPDGFRI
jgi:hypothetical protein